MYISRNAEKEDWPQPRLMFEGGDNTTKDKTNKMIDKSKQQNTKKQLTTQEQLCHTPKN